MIRLAAVGNDLGPRSRGGRGLYLCRESSCVQKGLMRGDVRKRLGASDCAMITELLETVAIEENCLDGSHVGRVICDQGQVGGLFG
jgi:hypothetical protein